MSDNTENIPVNTVETDTITTDTITTDTYSNTENEQIKSEPSIIVMDNLDDSAEFDIKIDIKDDNKIKINDNETENPETLNKDIPSFDPLNMIFSSLFQELMKPVDKNSDLSSLIEQFKKETDSNIFGFDVKIDPETKMTTFEINHDLRTETDNEEKDKNNLNNERLKLKLMTEIEDEIINTGGILKLVKADEYLEKHPTDDITKLNEWFKGLQHETSINMKKCKNNGDNSDNSDVCGELSGELSGDLSDECGDLSDACGDLNDFCVSINTASINNKIDVLNWWLDKHQTYNLPLKYSSDALDNASKVGHIEVLDWWFNSGLKMKYTEKAVDLANINGMIRSLDWWLTKSKDENNLKDENNSIEFKYSANSFNRCMLGEDEIIELVEWWKTNNLEIKYSQQFIDFMGNFRYIKLHEYLMNNKMIKSSDTLKIRPRILPRENVINIMELLGRGKQNSKPRYDTVGFPEEIIKHIEEKEQELDNNMLINGKAKEYIDSLVKIPFGKYRNENIFKFMGDYIKKVNDEVQNKMIVIRNESELIKFFKNVDNQQEYVKLYNLYCEFMILRVKYLEYVDTVLNTTVYGHESTKKQFKCIISQWLSGGFNKGVVIGVQGPPGVGKTSLIKGALAKCLVDFIDYDLEQLTIKLNVESEHISRPFSFISLGGSANGSTLIGHNITYHGSTHGDIVKCLKQAKVMNPIIFFDELDKLSKTENGYEISSVLTHITDPVQNEHFTDRYFTEVPIDLSRAVIVFSYNDASKIDRILLDRIKEINVGAITVREKVLIARNFMIPEICKNIGYVSEDISLTDEQIKNLVLEFTFEAGVRKLKEKLEEIIRNVHLDRLLKQEITELSVIDDDYISNIMNEHHKVILKKIISEPKVGCINGMYATSNGLGDIMHIQVKKTYTKEPLTLQTTGSLEKVISESINVAKTVAWNLLKPIEKNQVINSFVNTGIHIHCPDGSTSKDGPSAGGAITCAIYSLFTNKPIKTDISMTGEIDLDGNITAIGGLDAKLSGAKRAGVKIAYVPEENKRDVEILRKKMPELFDNTFTVEFINHISQVLAKVL